MKINEIKELATEDLVERLEGTVAKLQQMKLNHAITPLVERLEGTVAKLQQMKLNHAITPLENPSQIKLVRRDIARMKTELRQRELNK